MQVRQSKAGIDFRSSAVVGSGTRSQVRKAIKGLDSNLRPPAAYKSGILSQVSYLIKCVDETFILQENGSMFISLSLAWIGYFVLLLLG